MAITMLHIPEPSNDWIEGFTGNYVILSLKHSQPDAFVFWRADDRGYTPFLFNAGFYSRAQIEAAPNYYNDGFNAVAVPLTFSALTLLDLRIVIDVTHLARFANRVGSPIKNS